MVSRVFQDEINASEAEKAAGTTEETSAGTTDSIARFIRSLMMASSGGNYESSVTEGGKGTFVGAYGIPIHQWANWSDAAGYPGASWKDPRAQDAVARWAAQTLYNQFGDWGLVSIAWRFGTDEAMRFRNKFGTLTTTNIAEIWDEAEGVFYNDVVEGMDQTDGPSTMFGYSLPQMGDVQLRFTMEEGEDVLDRTPQEASPAHLALQNTLASMADTVAGGKRLPVEDVMVTDLSEDEPGEPDGGVKNVSPKDVEHLNG
jgi:hypothetical protein